jgi:hypothetical protein
VRPAAQTGTFNTGLQPGPYCDVTHGSVSHGTCSDPIGVPSQDSVAIEGASRLHWKSGRRATKTTEAGPARARPSLAGQSDGAGVEAYEDAHLFMRSPLWRDTTLASKSSVMPRAL